MKKKKGSFIKEGGEIFFQDRNGMKWDAECIDEMFEMVAAFNSFFRKAEYYHRGGAYGDY